MNKLHLLQENTNVYPEAAVSKREMRKLQLQATWDRYWLQQDDTAKELLQKKLILNWITRYLPSPSKILDAGCGRAPLFTALTQHEVHLLDISKRALEWCKATYENPTILHDCLPLARCLTDQSYDLVLLIDLIAEIESPLHRLVMSEIAATLKPGGLLICTTPLDTKSPDAVSVLLQLLKTEFEIVDFSVDYYHLGKGMWEKLARLCFYNPSHCAMIAKKKSEMTSGLTSLHKAATFRS